MKHKIIKYFRENQNVRLSFRGMFFSLLIMEIISSAATIVDSLIVSEYIGDAAVASIGLTYSIGTFQKLLSGLIAGGTRIACSDAIGHADSKKANQIFSTSVSVSIILLVGLALLGWSFAPELASLLGARHDAELIIPTARYIRGIMPGLPFVLLTALLIPIIQIDGSDRLARISVFVTIGVDILLDFSAVYLFEDRLLGVGLATSLSYIAAFLVIALHYFNKKAQFRFSIKAIRPVLFIRTIRYGFYEAFCRLMTIVRTITINYIILSIASTNAMSAFSLYSNLKTFLTAIPTAIGSAAILFASNLIVKRDLKGLRQVFKSSLFYGVVVMSILGIFVFILAEPVFSLFSLHEETVSYLVFLFKLFAFILPLWGIKYFYVSYFQGIGLRKLSTIFSVFGELIFAALPTWLFSRFLGINGIWIGLATTEVLSVLLILIFAIIHNKRFPRSIEGMLFLPKHFEDEEVSMLDLSAQNIKGMEEIHYLLERFCIENEIDENRTMAIRLSVEELSSYLLMNYKKREHLIDVQLRYCRKEDDVILNFRYNDPSFNPTTIHDGNEGDHDETMKNIGLQLIYKMSKDIRYVHFVSYAELLVEL